MKRPHVRSERRNRLARIRARARRRPAWNAWAIGALRDILRLPPPQGPSVMAIDDEGVVHLLSAGRHAMMSQEVAAMLLEDPASLAMPVPEDFAQIAEAVVDPFRGTRSMADEFSPVVPGRNRAEARANAARMRRT